MLDTLVNEWIAEEMTEDPVHASGLGFDGHDDRLPDLSATGFARRARRDDEWLAAFSELVGLAGHDAIDRDLVVSQLRGRQIMRDWEVWRRDPTEYLSPCLQGVFTLFLHRLHAPAQLAASAAARLRSVRRLLDEARANLSPELAAPVFVERAIGQARAGVTYARDLVPAEDPSLAEPGEEAAQAFESFAAWLSEDLLPRAHGSYAIGEARYSALLREKELLGYGAAEMRSRGEAAWAALDDEMRSVASKLGSPDWRAVVERLNEDHPPTPEAMQEEYAAWTARARAFLVEHELVTLPDGEECRVVPSPPFQRPLLAVASYADPPAFKPSLLGHFFVPFPPEGTPPEEVQQRLATNSYNTIPTVAVHEAYPGHHWHLTWVQANRRVARKVVWTSYFAEGWALFAERVMREHGFFADPRHDLCHLDARIFRAARIVVDTGLHIGDVEFDEAVEFMQQRASLSAATARAEVGRYCSWPTQAPSYLTGCLEIERIRASFTGSVREFNDTIAGSGVLPIALAERSVLG